MSDNPGNFKPGNSLWQQRNKIGREKVFATPALLWDAAVGYFEYMEKNPDKRQKVFGTGLVAEENVKRPFTIMGFCIYCGVNTAWFRQFKAEQAGITDSAFSTVIADIEEIVYNQKFEGASNGFFNANIISRDLGLVDKKEVDNKGTVTFIIDEDDDGLGRDVEPGNDPISDEPTDGDELFT